MKYSAVIFDMSGTILDMNKMTFIPGFLEFHAFLIRQGIATAVATNATTEKIARIQANIDLRALFGKNIYTCNYVGFRGKPAPDIYTYAAQSLRVNPEECVAIEDSAQGIIAAQGAGIVCIGINTHGKIAEIQAADAIIQEYDELYNEYFLPWWIR